jgi:hypothetical protein
MENFNYCAKAFAQKAAAAGLYVPSDLLGTENAKTKKGETEQVQTAILYLAPGNLSGQNLCAMAAIAGCLEPCLFTAGRAEHMSGINDARMNKTQLFIRFRREFMQALALEIARRLRYAQRKGFVFMVRLNGTSDIRWELVPVFVDQNMAKKIGCAPGEYVNIMAVFPGVIFYDYTKLPNRRSIPKNYDLTFSYSGLPAYQKYVQQAIAQGMRIAVVFRNEQDIPNTFLGLPCVPGDNSDLRPYDPPGVVVALYAKGKARTDMSGFVVDAPRRVVPLAIAA